MNILTDNCPLCHVRPRWNGVVSHTEDCPNIDLDSARWYAQRLRAARLEASDRVAVFVTNAQRWEGKFRVVCHENNKLRQLVSRLQTELEKRTDP